MRATRHPVAGVALIGAPSNLGLRPPEPGCVPGTAKAPEALREAGLHARLVASGARDAGVILPPRYRDDLRPGTPRLRNHDAIVGYTRSLATRIGDTVDRNDAPLVLGGDCSILIGAGLALARRGRFGLVHVDGHTDFRHPGNSGECGALAGEDLAAAVGFHWDEIADIEGRRPYFHREDTVHVGCRSGDEHLDEVASVLAMTITAAQARRRGPQMIAAEILEVVGRSSLSGFWIHLDVDILDPTVMPAVDSPDPGGLSTDELGSLVSLLAPRAIGAGVTVFDPDLDPEGTLAQRITDLLAESTTDLGSESAMQRGTPAERA